MSAPSDPRHDVLESTVRKLSVCIKLLSAAMVASVARIVLDGINIALALTAGVLAVLLTVSVALWRHGRRVERRAPLRDMNDAPP